MIHYNVWFAFAAGQSESEELARVSGFLDDLKRRELIHDYRLLRNRARQPNSRLPPFQANIVFRDHAQFGGPFRHIAETGVHDGLHGQMIANVSDMVVEIFDEWRPTP